MFLFPEHNTRIQELDDGIGAIDSLTPDVVADAQDLAPPRIYPIKARAYVTRVIAGWNNEPAAAGWNI